VALPTPSQVDREDLELSINVPDLREAVDSAAASRNPDLDGLSHEFYRAVFEFVARAMVAALKWSRKARWPHPCARGPTG
jgi:hypothetical protein